MNKKIKYRYLINVKLIIMVSLFIAAFLCISSCTRSTPGDEPVSPTNDLPLLVPLNSGKISVIEPSGLIYNSSKGTLFAITDNQPIIYELNTNGQVLGSIPISAIDLEGISFNQNYDTIYVVEETSKLLSSFTLQGKKISSISLNIPITAKNGPEGVAVNPNNNHIFVINSKSPAVLIELYPNGTEIWRKDITFATDLSDLCFDRKLNCLWLLTHDDKKLFKLNLDGTLIKAWKFDIIQAEGLAFSDNDMMYIVSDSDAMFYVFNKPN